MTRKRGRQTAEYIGRALEVPPGTLSRTCNMQLSGNREVLVDGCRGLIEYGDERIKINVGNGTVQFRPRTGNKVAVGHIGDHRRIYIVGGI